jgi:ribonuclease H / adenosylcobalamin/alpha-ribazole phosphatase
MTRIVLVRHAATTWSGHRYCGRANPPLSPAGRQMARDLAIELAPVLPAEVRIVTSPSRRARETAAAIAARSERATIEVDDRWQETDVGLAEGLTFDAVAARWPGLAGALAAGEVEIDWPGGETARALRRRIGAAWSAVVATGRPTLVVSHAGSIRVAAALATGRSVGEVEFLEPAAWLTYDVPTVDRAETSRPKATV